MGEQQTVNLYYVGSIPTLGATDGFDLLESCALVS